MKKSEVQIKLESNLSSLQDQVMSLSQDLRLRDLRSDTEGRTVASISFTIDALKDSISSLQTMLQSIDSVTDTKVSKSSQIDTADIAAAPGAYDQSHMQTVVDLLNEIKAKINLQNTY